MSESIFREKSLERIKSPENMNDYIKVATPGVWVVLAAVIILLIGAFVWGEFGYIESYSAGQTTVKNNVAFTQTNDVEVSLGMDYVIGDKTYKVENVEFDDNNPGVMKVSATVDMPDGLYDSKIVIERIKPLSLIFR